MSGGRIVGLLVAVVMIVVGGLWFAQGNGYVDGGFTHDSGGWATFGAVVAAFGVALVIVLVQNRRR